MSSYRAKFTFALSMLFLSFTLAAQAETVPGQTESPAPAAEAKGPSTGGGDTSYISAKPVAPMPQQAPVAQPSAQVTPDQKPVATDTPAPAVTPPVEAKKATPPADAAAVDVPRPDIAAAPPSKPVEPQKLADPIPIAPAVQQSATPAATPPTSSPADPAVAKVPPAVTKPATPPPTTAAKAKDKPVNKPVKVVRNASKPAGTQRVTPPDNEPNQRDSIVVYRDEGPYPPRPIGRNRQIMQDDGPDEDVVVVRRVRRVECPPRFLPGLWLFHRDRCY